MNEKCYKVHLQKVTGQVSVIAVTIVFTSKAAATFTIALGLNIHALQWCVAQFSNKLCVGIIADVLCGSPLSTMCELYQTMERWRLG